jgi:NADPH:quinone reductase-like Zn-dependent oxidoreductase
MAMTSFPGGAGGYAELAVVDADLAAPIPDGCSFVDAAAVPLAAGTAWEVLQRLRPPPGAWLLVHSASGGVGTLLVQVATAAGVRVIAVGGAAFHRLLGTLGAARCLDYHAADARRRGAPAPGEQAQRRQDRPPDPRPGGRPPNRHLGLGRGQDSPDPAQSRPD